MECETESYSLISTIYPFFVTFMLMHNIGKILNFVFNKPGVGIVKSTKNKLTVKTDRGNLCIPSVKLPNFETYVFFFDKEVDLEDGMVDLEKVNNISNKEIIPCKQHRNILITDILRPSDLGKKTLRGCIRTEFEEKCFIFTVKEGDIIDYVLLFKNYEEELETSSEFENLNDKN